MGNKQDQQMQLARQRRLQAQSLLMNQFIQSEMQQPQDRLQRVLSKVVECGVCMGEEYENGLIFKCRCGMRMCNDCFTQWWQTQLKDHVYAQDININCPGKAISKCKVVYSEQTVKRMFDTFPNRQIANFHEEQINVVLFERYLTLAEDIRVCPKEGCSYAGVIDAKKGACYENLICLRCRHEWKDPLHFTKFEEWRTGFNDLIQFRSEALNNMSKLVLTEPCPNPKCGYYIQKNAGCAHMQCSMCRYEFCWRCLGQYPGYVHSQNDNGAVCGQRQIVLGLFYALFGLIIFIKVLQQIQLFTDSVSAFLFTHDMQLLKKQGKFRNDSPVTVLLVPLLMFVVKLISIMFVIGVSFVICCTVYMAIDFYRRLSENNPHLNFQQKLSYMQTFGYILLGALFCVGYFSSIIAPVFCLTCIFFLSAARAMRGDRGGEGFRLW